MMKTRSNLFFYHTVVSRMIEVFSYTALVYVGARPYAVHPKFFSALKRLCIYAKSSLTSLQAQSQQWRREPCCYAILVHKTGARLWPVKRTDSLDPFPGPSYMAVHSSTALRNFFADFLTLAAEDDDGVATPLW